MFSLLLFLCVLESFFNGKTAKELIQHFCIVGIAPSIGPDDYEVDLPVLAEISKLWQRPEQFCRPARPGHWLLDLWRWNQLQFINAGVKTENIHIAGVSTARQPELFFSHRASQGTAGRFGVLMTL